MVCSRCHQETSRTTPAPRRTEKKSFFINHARTNEERGRSFLGALETNRPGKEFFYGGQSLPTAVASSRFVPARERAGWRGLLQVASHRQIFCAGKFLRRKI